MVLDFKVNARLVVGMTINFFYTPTSDFFVNILSKLRTRSNFLINFDKTYKNALKQEIGGGQIAVWLTPSQ